MRFRKEVHFPGTVAQVRAMMQDPDYRNAVAVAAGGHPAEVTFEEVEEGLAVRTETRPSLAGIPGFVRPLVGAGLVIHQEELWLSDHEVRLSATSPGKPGDVTGTITLAPAADGGTLQTTEADIEVRVRIIGGQVERLLCRVLGSLVKTQGRIGADWLDGRR